jgi:hypothetical protein
MNNIQLAFAVIIIHSYYTLLLYILLMVCLIFSTFTFPYNCLHFPFNHSLKSATNKCLHIGNVTVSVPKLVWNFLKHN